MGGEQSGQESNGYPKTHLGRELPSRRLSLHSVTQKKAGRGGSSWANGLIPGTGTSSERLLFSVMVNRT